jgi:hypothetical protein
MLAAEWAYRLARKSWRQVSPPEAAMGLMDRVKAQATQLAQQTKEAAQEGKAKLDQAQASRRGDAMLRQLGALVYADRTGRGTPDSQAKVDQLISDISTHEQANGLNLAGDQSQPQPTVPPQPGFPPDPPSPFPGPPSPFPGPQSAFPGQQNQFPSPFADPASSTSFPAGSTTFPDAPATSFPEAPAPTEGESGATSAFPPES